MQQKVSNKNSSVGEEEGEESAEVAEETVVGRNVIQNGKNELYR